MVQEKQRLYFENLEVLLKTLTPGRWTLLKILHANRSLIGFHDPLHGNFENAQHFFDIFLTVDGREKSQMHPGDKYVVQPEMKLKLGQCVFILAQQIPGDGRQLRSGMNLKQ